MSLKSAVSLPPLALSSPDQAPQSYCYYLFLFPWCTCSQKHCPAWTQLCLCSPAWALQSKHIPAWLQDKAPVCTSQCRCICWCEIDTLMDHQPRICGNPQSLSQPAACTVCKCDRSIPHLAAKQLMKTRAGGTRDTTRRVSFDASSQLKGLSAVITFWLQLSECLPSTLQWIALYYLSREVLCCTYIVFPALLRRTSSKTVSKNFLKSRHNIYCSSSIHEAWCLFKGRSSMAWHVCLWQTYSGCYSFSCYLVGTYKEFFYLFQYFSRNWN